MVIFRFPEEAREERDGFCVAGTDASGGHADEVMLVPAGGTADAGYDGPLLYLDQTLALDTLPISAQTLVPITLAAHFPENPVCLSTNLTQGTLRHRVASAQKEFGSRLWLVVEPYCHLFPLPCSHGRSEPVSRARSAILRSENRCLYTEAFCCQYCTLLRKRGLLHLYDTAETIQQKLKLAQSLGVGRVIVLPT